MTLPGVTFSKSTFASIKVPVTSILQVLSDILIEARTGSLTINFHRGVPAGTIEWKQSVEDTGVIF